MKIIVCKKSRSAFEGSESAKDYVKDKLGKVSMMIDDADRKLADAQSKYDRASDVEPAPKSDYAEGASDAINYAQKQLDFIEDRLDDYMDDYNLTYL